MIQPDEKGHFGIFGGKFVPEALQAALQELTVAFAEARRDPAFAAQLQGMQRHYAGRPTPITVAKNLSAYAGKATIFLKREDLNHTGAHKINNVLGQGLLAKKMGKSRVIAETGAGQHGVATATVAALLGLECRIYMGEIDTQRQGLNVARMQLLGAEVFAVAAGSRTLKDAMNEAMRDWVTSVDSTHYLLGTVGGPHPFPYMVREFQRIISTESRAQMLTEHGCLPTHVVACVGGGSNAIGQFYDFIPDEEVALVGVEAGGSGVETGKHSATIGEGRVGVLHGARTFILADEDGQTIDSHSISAGLDYPGVGPEHAWLADTGRATYPSVTDGEAMDAFKLLSRSEGIIPAIESAHAVAGALRLGRELAISRPDLEPRILVCLSGRGDKDTATAFDWFSLSGKPDQVVGA